MILNTNTGVSSEYLSEKIILCAGEDEGEVLAALKKNGYDKARKTHLYRFYHFRKYDEFTLIICAIGTGAIEPLLSEIFSFKIIRKIVLIGTAGKFQSSEVQMGEPYLIREAFIAGCGLGTDGDIPATYHFEIRKIPVKTTSIVSSDLYYGFSSQSHFSKIKDVFERYKTEKSVDMIDMEAGQFYTLCKLLTSNEVEYVALKGPANTIDNWKEQATNSKALLDELFVQGLKLLEIIKPRGVAHDIADDPCPSVETDSKKMIEEIKLYWFIQAGTVSVLGFLAEKIKIENRSQSIFTLFIIFLLLSITSIYNIVGNYYIRCEAEKIGATKNQENLIAPIISILYLFIAGIVGYMLGTIVIQKMEIICPDKTYNVFRCSVSGAILSVLVLYTVTNIIFNNLYISGSEGYKRYSKNFKYLYCINLYDVVRFCFRIPVNLVRKLRSLLSRP